MSIRIIDEPELVLTRSEHDRLHREWQATQTHTVAPSSFETWVRHCRAAQAQSEQMEAFAIRQQILSFHF